MIFIIFRHTGLIENVNNLILKYASKRISHEFMYYEARMYLACLDHNMHIFRENAKSSRTGEELFHRKYSKRSKNFSVVNVKTSKTYPHIRRLLVNIINRQKSDVQSVTRPFNRPENDPKLISRNIGMKAPLPTSELQAKRISRFDS